MPLSIIGIDLGKTSCSLVGVDTAGKVLVRRCMRRDTVVAFCSKYPGSIVAMKAYCGPTISAVLLPPKDLRSGSCHLNTCGPT